MKLLPLIKTLIFLANAVVAIGSCNFKCDDHNRIIQELLLDTNYIPWVIPYHKDSTVYFLKNGIDTVAFTCINYSHGFETNVISDEDEKRCGSAKSEYIKAKLYAQENGDIFEIAYDRNYHNGGRGEVYILFYNKNSFSTSHSSFGKIAYKPFYDKPINGIVYDNVAYRLSNYENDTIMIKYPNSIVKISVGDVYELLDIK